MLAPGMEQPRGSEFRSQRLRQTQSVAPAARPPEVAAFVDSHRLLRQACKLLPLTAREEPALPHGAAARQAVLRAFGSGARAGGIASLFQMPPSPLLQVSGQGGGWMGGWD